MSLFRQFAHGVRALLWKKRVADELDEELRAFIEAAAEQKMRFGMPREEALRAARVEVGSVAAVKDNVHDAGWESMVERVYQDVHYAMRWLRKSPGFTSVAILTLALGVGATTAIFSIVNAVLLRPLPYREPNRLVRIYFNEPGVGLRDVTFSKPELDDLIDRAGVFEDVSAIAGGSANLTGSKQPQRIEFVLTSFNYFSMLGATPQIGRLYGPQDFALGFSPAVVISDALWRRDYGADPDVVGRTLRLDNDPCTIVGVLPQGFRHPGPTVSGDVELWTAAGFSAEPFPKPVRGIRGLNAGTIGRLRRGVTLAQAQARLTAMAHEIRHDFPTDYPPQAGWTIEIQPLQETLVGNVRPMLLVLMAAVIVVVFIVSLNIANLLLARASGRQREMAVRSALGASRGRMIRQMLTESILLSFLGGLAGIATAFGTLRFILQVVPPSIPRLSEVRLDWVVLGFALFISVLTGLLFGLAPALHSAKGDLSSAIREGGRAGYSTRIGRLRDVVIVSELAFAVMLMVGAGLLLRTLRDLLRENPGFNPTHVVAAKVWLPVPDNPKEDPYAGIAPKVAFARELLRRMKTIPGVEMAAITTDLPTTSHRLNDPIGNYALVIEDRPVESSEDLRAERVRISPDYFRLMQAPLERGRSFAEGDEDGKQAVAIIDETAARKYWPGRDPLGRRIRFGQDPTRPWMTVVGIVKDIKSDGLDVDGVPHVYVSIYQDPWRSQSLVLRTLLPANALAPQIRREVQSIDSGLPVFGVAAMGDVLDASLASRRFSAHLVGGFAGLALLLASIGIYGLLAYTVSQRSREIGLRMALGARREDVLRLFLRKGLVLAGVGIAAGVILSASTASMIASLLYGVRPRDPIVFLAVPLILFAVAVLASYLPAWRATKVDPMATLREA